MWQRRKRKRKRERFKETKSKCTEYNSWKIHLSSTTVPEPKSKSNDKMRCKCDQSKRYAVDMNGITFKVAFDAA